MLIHHLNIEVTRKCNQKCFYCFNNSGWSAQASTVSIDSWIQILSVMKQSGLKSVHITGGEPFVWSETTNLLRSAQQLDLNTSILSNGFQIDNIAKEQADVLNKLTVAQISLDAMNPELHDSRRGLPGAWQQAMNAIKTLRSLQVPVEISATISDENIGELAAIGQYANSVGARLLVRPLVLMGRAKNTNLSSLFQKRLERVLDALKEASVDVVNDRFSYVPVTDDIDAINSQNGMLTVEPDGKFRGGSFLRNGRQLITNALELLQVA